MYIHPYLVISQHGVLVGVMHVSQGAADGKSPGDDVMLYKFRPHATVWSGFLVVGNML